MTSTDAVLRAADAVFAAEQAVGRARGVVEDLHTTILSALRVLDDAELDSAKARLTDRGDFYLEAAMEHLSRLQTRCNDMPQLTHELDGHLNRASRAAAESRDIIDEADTTDPAVANDVVQLKARVAVVGEMISLATPMARLAAEHVTVHAGPARKSPRRPCSSRSASSAASWLPPRNSAARMRTCDFSGTSWTMPRSTPARRLGSPARSPTTPAGGWQSTGGTPAPARLRPRQPRPGESGTGPSCG